VHRVEESAAVVEQRLKDLLECGVIRRRGIPELEADDREHLTGRRNGPLNELSAPRQARDGLRPSKAARLLKCAEQFRPFDKLRAAPSSVEGRRERQRSAGAEGHAKEFTT
jgi:hypothetical protein